jgi:hypothetical protein
VATGCFTAASCQAEATKLGFQRGGRGYPFTSASYSQKGCFVFTPYSIAFFGAGGSVQDMANPTTIRGTKRIASCNQPPASQFSRSFVGSPPPETIVDICDETDVEYCAQQDKFCEIDLSTGIGLIQCVSEPTKPVSIPVSVPRQISFEAIELCLNEAACKAAANEQNLAIGGGGFAFAGYYAVKGCFTYSYGQLTGRVFYGLGGSSEDMKTSDPAILGKLEKFAVRVETCQTGTSSVGAVGSTGNLFKSVCVNQVDNIKGVTAFNLLGKFSGSTCKEFLEAELAKSGETNFAVFWDAFLEDQRAPQVVQSCCSVVEQRDDIHLRHLSSAHQLTVSATLVVIISGLFTQNI